jgi:hypothetical protein
MFFFSALDFYGSLILSHLILLVRQFSEGRLVLYVRDPTSFPTKWSPKIVRIIQYSTCLDGSSGLLLKGFEGRLVHCAALWFIFHQIKLQQSIGRKIFRPAIHQRIRGLEEFLCQRYRPMRKEVG